MRKRPAFINGEIYHVFNRGVERRQIFPDEKDHLRFIHDLFEFNDTASAFNAGYYFSFSGTKSAVLIPRKPRNFLVEIFCFCLMPDHFHLLLRQRVDSGITEFMRKLGTGYANYFNQKYQRVGHLFQGKFKAVHVTREAHLRYLPHYIHLNPLDLWMPEWRSRELRSVREALSRLASYRWSSYTDYIGGKNFPSVTQRDGLLEIYGSPTSIDYRGEVEEWLAGFDPEAVRDVAIEAL